MNDIPPNDIGRRLREIRAWRGQSLEVVAGLAGISYGYLGRLERGEQPLTNRGTLEALARALKVAPSEFTGPPWEVDDGPEREAYAGLVAIERVLDECELDEDSDVEVREWQQVKSDLDRLEDLFLAADYSGQGELVPGLLTELHALYVRRPELRRSVLIGLIRCYNSAAWTTKRLGCRGLPLIAAKSAEQCAEELGSPEWMGFATWLRGNITGPLSRVRQYRRAVAMADQLTGSLDDSNVLQAYGMLHLSAALASAVQADRNSAVTHLDEAAAVAERMDEEVGSFGRMWFGRTNVAIWRASVGLELGDGASAVEAISNVHVDAIPSPVRVAGYYCEAGRTLLLERNRRDNGLQLLLKAEYLAPQRVHSDIFVREAVADHLRTARRDAGGRNLRGLAWRLGIAPELNPNA